jgi:hypothetical protein
VDDGLQQLIDKVDAYSTRLISSLEIGLPAEDRDAD